MIYYFCSDWIFSCLSMCCCTSLEG